MRRFATLMTAALLSQSVNAGESGSEANHSYVCGSRKTTISGMNSCRTGAMSRRAVRVNAPMKDVTKSRARISNIGMTQVSPQMEISLRACCITPA